jgi:hypothetical protein
MAAKAGFSANTPREPGPPREPGQVALFRAPPGQSHFPSDAQAWGQSPGSQTSTSEADHLRVTSWIGQDHTIELGDSDADMAVA